MDNHKFDMPSSEVKIRITNSLTDEEYDEQCRKMKPGAKVQRGRDWRYGDSDGGPGSWGVVVPTTKMYDNQYIAVDWNNGNHSTYRMYNGIYTLKLADQKLKRRSKLIMNINRMINKENN
ncbi:unnamed protein product [Meganyctiphanes norvegica]|uniref:MIB/HERC2 domain-containing protein n=1 Tax=Meganyctiphanes norvegica TaxID=48144 RepID=A0AAV2QHC6_MEGNR